LISFDAVAVEAFDLDRVSHAVLFFDRTRKIIGVKPTNDKKEKGAFKLSRRRRSVSLKAPQFFDTYGLSIEDSKRFDVGIDQPNEMIVIDIKGIKRRRGRRPKQH
jgi:hypothetical protein